MLLYVCQHVITVTLYGFKCQILIAAKGEECDETTGEDKEYQGL